MSRPPEWMFEGASEVRKAQIRKDWAARQRRAHRTMEAGNLMIGQWCDDIASGKRGEQ